MLDDESVVRLLMQAKVLSPFRLNLARRMQRKTGTPLYDVLLEHKLVDEAKVLQAIGAHTATPCASLSDFEGDPNLIDRVPRELAEAYRVLPIGLMTSGEIERLFLAMVDPTDIASMESISQVTGYDVEPVLVGPTDLRSAIARVYGVRESDVNFEEPEADPDPRVELPELGEWDNMELDGESQDFLRDLLDNSENPTSRIDLGPQPVDKSGRPTELLHSEVAPLREGMAVNVFRDFMTRSAVAILSPLENEVLQRRPMREVGSKELLQAVVRVLIQRGIISEKEIMDELAESRKRRTRGER